MYTCIKFIPSRCEKLEKDFLRLNTFHYRAMFAPPKGLNSWHWGHLFQNFDRGPRLDHQNIGPALQPEPMTNKFHNLGRGLLEHYNHALRFFFRGGKVIYFTTYFSLTWILNMLQTINYKNWSCSFQEVLITDDARRPMAIVTWVIWVT